MTFDPHRLAESSPSAAHGPAESYQAAAELWHHIPLSAERFAANWLRLSDSREGPLDAHAGDIYLVAACLDGVPAALAELDRLLRAQAPALASFGLSNADVEDVLSTTLAGLLEGKLRRYSGRGPLEAWLRVTLTNRLLDRLRASPQLVELDDVLLGTLSTSHVPELELARRQFRGSFSAGFKLAIARLTPRQRNLLRQHHLDELTLEELSALYHVHRATVARWLADARVALLDFTRDEVSKLMGVARHDVDSIVRLISSRFDLSAGLFLSSASGVQS